MTTLQDTSGPQRAKILVVEDDPAILRLLMQILDHAGYDVTAAIGGQSAIELLDKQRFDMVVLDVMLPKVDGFGVLQHLRGTNSLSSIRILMLTALGRDADWLKGLKAGAHDYITKPFDHEELVEVVIKLMAMNKEALIQHRRANLERARVLAQLENMLDPTAF